ncbi:hypothetical protein EMIHUDRAFT_122768, partial [Emiliania huxleyi CCMP1516]
MTRAAAALCLAICAGADAYERIIPTDQAHADIVGQTNYQGGQSCRSLPTVIGTASEKELSEVMRRTHSIRAVGTGANWNINNMACAAAGGFSLVTAAMCEVDELTGALPFYLAPAEGTATATAATPDIKVDEAKGVVTVKTCVTVQALNEYLAAYRTEASPTGYMLPEPGTIYAGQTVGGAVATATHAHSLVEGSWSAKVLEARLMTADGEVIEGVSEATRPLLWRALKTSGGRLGVLLDVTVRIVKHRMIKVSYGDELSASDFIIDVKQTAMHVAQA